MRDPSVSSPDVLSLIGDTPLDGRAAEKAGADVLIAQGVEAGGHVHGHTGALVLVEEIAREARVPVIATGGFATGAGLVAAMALGAQAPASAAGAILSMARPPTPTVAVNT